MTRSTLKPAPDWARELLAELPPVLPLKRAAKAASVHERTLRRAEERGEIRLMRTGPGGRVLVGREDLARLLATWAGE